MKEYLTITPETVFEKVIGLEVHVQLATASKAFCRDAVSFGAAPNTAVSPVSLAHPGTLPVANMRQVEYAIKLGLALEGEINLNSSFDRKNYFYADSPKGYQITQDRHPIVLGGNMDVKTADGGIRTIRIHHIHMEEDAGKSLHDQHEQYSFVDLNRAGTPLLEIVTEPDFRSGEEVSQFMEQLRALVRWLDISDGNMEEGSLRCDVNISLRPQGQQAYGQRCEIKNMNSMRFARKAIEHEEERQSEILRSGGQINQQTRGFNPDNGTTYPLRDKEDAHDYRYFPDPDLPPVVLTTERVAKIRAEMPDLPKAIYKKCITEFGLIPADAEIIVSDRATAQFYLSLVAHASPTDYRGLAQLLIQKIRPSLQQSQQAYDSCGIDAGIALAFVSLIREGKVSHSVAYQQLYPAILKEEPAVNVYDLALRLGILQDQDADTLVALAQEVLAKYPDKVKDYQSGKKNLMGLFMGDLMKAAKGKANPQEATRVLTELLKK